MFGELPKLTIIVVFLILTLLYAIKFILRKEIPFASYINYLWIYFLIFSVAEIFSFKVAVWILAILCFWSLREYFSLIDIRLQDRWGIIGAYLSIPFMIYYIQIDWYGMFIVSIPVYAFLMIPFLIAIGGKESKGIIFSTGAIDFGMFLFVYCLGHIGYLALYSRWMAIMLIINVVICDIIMYFIQKKTIPMLKSIMLKYFISSPFTVLITVLLSNWTTIPTGHSISLGLMIPVLIIIGNHTINYIKFDLGIDEKNMCPGRGAVIDNMKSIFYSAPVVFHYIRYFLK